MVTYPKAEMFARRMALPMIIDPIVKELYGYATPVLDKEKAIRILNQNGFWIGPQTDAAIDILEQRISLLSVR